MRDIFLVLITVTLSLAPASVPAALFLAGCGDDGGDDDDDVPGDDDDDDDVVELSGPWSHDGEVTGGTPVAPTAPYFREIPAAENGLEGVLVAGRGMVVDLDGDGWDDLVTMPVDNGASDSPPAPAEALVPTLARNLGGDGAPFRFANATGASGLGDAPMAIAVLGDVDGDGDQDLFAGQSARSRATPGIFLNDGDGAFTAVDDPGVGTGLIVADVWVEQAAGVFGDFDGDGNLDLYVGSWRSGTIDAEGRATGVPFRDFGEPDELFLGDGTGRFVAQELPPQTNPRSVEVHPDLAGTARPAYGACTADVDDDGDLDVFVNNYGAGRPALGSPPRYYDHNFLWRNDSAGPGAVTFVDVGVAAGVDATLRGIGGVQDESSMAVRVGGQTYPHPIGGNGFGCHFGDLDNDGDMDLAVGTIAHPDYPQSDRAMLHINQGNATFTEESAERGLEYTEDELHPVLVDVDQDGRLDLGMSRLRCYEEDRRPPQLPEDHCRFELYLQEASGGTFAMIPNEDTGIDIRRPSATVWSDIDHDGDLDFFMPKGDGGRLFENTVGQANGHLVLELVARGPRDATGARVTATTSAGTQTREVTSGGGHYNNQHTRRVHFGLGGDSGARDVTIRWPGGGVTRLGDVTAGYTLRVEQGGDATVLAEP